MDRPRWLALLASALVVAGLAAQGARAQRLLGASRRLRAVEVTSLRAVQLGARRGPVLEANLAVLRDAQRMDPAEVGVPLARGSVLYLLGRLEPSIAAYREALRLEARPEIYLNLGRALRAHGEVAEGEREMARAARLDPRLAAELGR
jgi:tetratricopeptide (TPR) repeat protein